MKSKTLLTLGMGFLLALVCGNLFSQSTLTTGNSSLTAGPQSVTTTGLKNPDILIITGKILDATTKEPVKNAKINFDRFGDELLQASIDEKGNYALALNKKELGEPIRIVFRINGYKKYVVKGVHKNSNYLDADIFLEPADSDLKSEGKIKYVMRDDPFNTMVIKMQ
jgi:hypothetical protein